MISAPVILYPKTNWVAGSSEKYYSDSLVQMISGYIPVASADYEDNVLFSVQYRYQILRDGTLSPFTAFSESGITVGMTNSNVVEIPWSLNTDGIISLQNNDVIYFEFKSVKRSNVYTEVGIILDESSVIYLNAEIVSEELITATVDPSTGVQIKQARDYIKILVPRNSILLNGDSEFSGCSFYISLVAGGGEDGYVRMNDVLVTMPDALETTIENLEESSIVDSANDLTVTTVKSRQVANEFYTYSFTKDVLSRLVSESKLPNIFLSDGTSLSQDRRYYFVASVNAYDEVLNQSIESGYSQELEGKFVVFTDEYESLPPRTRNDVLFTITKDLQTNNSKINAVAGSVIRDISDPIATEFERYYIIQDFVFIAGSLDTLLNFDDADGDGISDPISTSIKKRRLADALGLTDGATLQILIDEQFDKYASNYDIERQSAQKSVVKAVCYVTQKPTEDILIPDQTVLTYPGDTNQNLVPVSFLTSGTKILDAKNADYYYNPSTRRYEIEVDAEAQIAGSSGNVPSQTISVISNVNPVVQVINNVPAQYGSNRESNLDLSTRVKLARISYDSGTQGGYAAEAYEVPGVIEARVEQGGDPLMIRDYDTSDQKHIGGKVDIYIKGERNIQSVDQIAFKYEYPTDTYGKKVGEVFEIISARDFRIKTKNLKVSDNSPIVVVHTVRNITRSQDYSLDNFKIVGDGDTIILDKNITNNNIGMAAFDVVEVDYRYRSSNEITLSLQPVESVVEVTDYNGTIIDPSKYKLVKLDDPLVDGLSNIAKDSVKFYFDQGDGIENFIEVVNEEHDMLLNVPSKLNYKGVDIDTIVVSNYNDDSEVYIKGVDYEIDPGNETVFTYVVLLPNSKIRHGDRVYVDYSASQNFNITYITNSLVQDVQDRFDKMKHACADAITKVAVSNNIDLSFKVISKSGVDSKLLQSRLQTSIANYVAKIRMGESFTQGALTNVVHNTTGVKEIVMPLVRMMKRNSSFIPLDDLGVLRFETYHKTSAEGITSYISSDSVLSYRTSTNGGDSNLFRAVYENNIALQISENPSDVSKARGQCYIQSDGRIIVSTMDGSPPQNKYYKAAYYTYYSANENLVGDIYTSEIEYLDVDSQSLKDIEIIEERVVKRGL